uniref:Protein MMS22-like n=1 Tax=Anopheles dirus TaxID=7168 RepID=A0A182NP69_9DIPT
MKSIFDCRSSDCSASSNIACLRNFARDGSVAFGLPLDTGTTVLGVGVYQLHEQLVYELSMKARQLIQKQQKCIPQRINCSVQEQRLEITRFLRLVLANVATMKGETLCESISMVTNCLPRLLDLLMKYGWSVYHKDYNRYEIYHAVMEWRWLSMLLSMESETSANTTDTGESKRNTSKANNHIYADLMNDLVGLAFYQYRINTMEDIIAESPYHCNCVKLMWLGMMILAETHTEQLDFWACFTEHIPSVIKGRKDGFLFKIWLINALAQFYGQQVPDENGKLIITLAPNYAHIDAAVKDLLGSDCKEQHVRVFLVLLKPIITGWWPVRFETVIIIWDYFSVRLNSPFQLNHDPLEAMGCVSRSVAGFIEQASILAAPESTLDSLDIKTNSFRMFLILLAAMIRHCTKQGLKTKVQIIFNRIFLKLGPNKYENMTEQGIYNLGLMLLTMISATTYQEDYSRVSKHMQMVRVIDAPQKLPVDAIVKRIVIAMRAHMALLDLFSKTTYDKSAHISALLQTFDKVYEKYGNRLLPAMEAIAEGMISILNKASSRGSFASGETKLIGPWMVKYLRYGANTTRFNLLDAISSCLLSKLSWKEDDCLKAMNEHIMPFVKEQFSKPVSTPPCVAKIAAQLTVCNEALSMKDDKVVSLFNSFANNPTAHSDQVLLYLKEITKCPKMLTILDEKIIIIQWLKMGLYFDRECLLDLSRVVHGLGEFRSLCEIPQYELFESNASPIELFFRFVGLRYREVDSNMKIKMKMKLYTLFQHFDKWVPDPKGMIRQRILAVLLIALKECASAFYIKANSNCLYHLAFKHFFLPFTVLTDRNVQLDYIEDIVRIWHKIMDILGKMDYRTNPAIGDDANNMLVKWIPQFAKIHNPEDALKSLLLFFCSRNEDLVLFTMTRFVTMYVDLQRCLPKTHAPQALQLLHRIIETLNVRKDYGKIKLLINTAGLAIAQHAFMCNETYPTRVAALNMLYDLLASTEGPSNLVKDEMKAVLSSFTHKYLPLSAECYFTFMCRLADRYPNFIRSLMDVIGEVVAQAEKMRGRGTDSFLRNLLHRLE